MICGGATEAHGDLFFPPTNLANVHPHMRIAQKEIFGPVLSIMTCNDTTETNKLASATNYGLTAYIWTKDMSAALHSARRIYSERVWVNGSCSNEEYTELKSIHLQIGPQTE